MDNEQDIKKAAEKLSKDKGCSKMEALSILQSKYESENRLEEAVIVKRVMEKEASDIESAKGFHYDM